MFRVIDLLFCMLFINLSDYSVAVTKRWIFNSSIYNRDNWVGGKVTKDCNKFQFAELNTATIIVDQIEAGEIVLPTFGIILLKDGAMIKVNQEAQECIELKRLYMRNWFSPKAWSFDGKANSAMPDEYKIPCQYDDVIIPEPTDVLYWPTDHDIHVKVKSVQYGGRNYNERNLYEFYQSLEDYDCLLNPHNLPLPQLNREHECKDPTGCVCQNKNLGVFCTGLQATHKEQCENPVAAYGFCNDICGAYIKFDYEDGFRLSKIEELLSKYKSVDNHVGKFRSVYGNFIQMVFSEKEYNGDSVDYAGEFYEKLTSQKGELNIKNIEISKSGTPLMAIRRRNSVVGLIFGTLIAVTVIFGILFYLYGDEERIYYLKNGLGLGSRPFAGLTLPFSAKYVKEEESGLIVERRSIPSLTSSITDIDKSFENPMFGASTSERSKTDEVQKTSTPNEPSVISHENPLYDIANKKEDEQDSESSGNEE